MKISLLTCFLFVLINDTSAQTAAGTWSVKFSDAIMSRWPTTINNMTGKNWEYSNGIITHGMEKVYNNVTTPAYLTYIKNYVDTYVTTSGTFTGVTFNSLDRIHPGISILFLYEKYKSISLPDSTKYRKAAKVLRDLLVGPSATYSKTSNGILWHKLAAPYTDVVMLDGIYMAHPFLAKYGRLFNDAAAIDTAVNQTLFVYNQLYDPTTRLIKHAWTSDPPTYAWDNGVNGNSNEVWSRAMGWYVMAIVDILKYVPAGHPKRANLITALSNLAIGIKNYQDASTGLWYQVVDKGVGKPGYTAANYIESSGSAMFVYALKTASDSGWINAATYLPVAQAGWNGLKANEITINSGDSKPQINNFAPAMSVQNNYAGYVGITSVDCPTTTNPHGYAAILMAASVMEFPLTPLPSHFLSFTLVREKNGVVLNWANTDNYELHHFGVERSVDGKNFTTIGTVQPNANGKYSYTDPLPLDPICYYRINVYTLANKNYYSALLTTKKANASANFTVFPNPVQNGQTSLIMENLGMRNIDLQLINTDGKIIYKKHIYLETGSGSISLSLPATIKSGIYYIQLTGDKQAWNTKLFVE